ncbi:MAG TPA: hypothetical protein VG457_14370 [Planctomycetota bacterium]|jgi:hypothetical protein|nr:hypothetical protein [Planctomycetota bacterium]
MPLAAIVLGLLVGFPGLIVAAIWLRLRAKDRLRDDYLDAVREDLRGAGFEPVGDNLYRLNGRGAMVEASTNPLFGRGFSVRLASWSSTIHEFELRRGKPVAPEFEAFKPLLARWESAGKMYVDCYAAGITDDPRVSADVSSLVEIAKIPLTRIYRGGAFTYREGFEAKIPQWQWRHDQRPKLPKDVHRYCFSYWQDGPLLNPVILRVLWELSGDSHRYHLSDAADLRFLEFAFERRDMDRRGALLELMKPEMPVAADLRTDGEFFGGLLVAKEPPPGFEQEGLPRTKFHDTAIQALRKVDFYARRLYDDEFSWYSGEYEIISLAPLDVRGTISRIATEIGAQVMDIDRRFHKRLVVPLGY